jgi:hypothetical protein
MKNGDETAPSHASNAIIKEGTSGAAHFQCQCGDTVAVMQPTKNCDERVMRDG